MHIEFLDLLRCPKPHEETWLVAALHRMDGRQVIQAKLGCPVCGAEFFIRDGVALFGDEVDSDNLPVGPTIGGPTVVGDEMATRIAAFLDLTAPGKLVLLAGQLAGASDSLAELAEARIVALNAPSLFPHPVAERVAELVARPPVPLAAKSLDGIALDDSHSTSEMLTEAARLLRPRGRLLAGATAELSPEFRELARDTEYLVAEYAGELVTLRR